jgi:hypothetical protein
MWLPEFGSRHNKVAVCDLQCPGQRDGDQASRCSQDLCSAKTASRTGDFGSRSGSRYLQKHRRTERRVYLGGIGSGRGFNVSFYLACLNWSPNLDQRRREPSCALQQLLSPLFF